MNSDFLLFWSTSEMCNIKDQNCGITTTWHNHNWAVVGPTSSRKSVHKKGVLCMHGREVCFYNKGFLISRQLIIITSPRGPRCFKMALQLAVTSWQHAYSTSCILSWSRPPPPVILPCFSKWNWRWRSASSPHKWNRMMTNFEQGKLFLVLEWF